jgi:hypothetical protein
MVNGGDLLTHISILHIIIVNSHILQTVTSASLAVPVIFAFAAGPEFRMCSFDALAKNRVLDELEVGGQDRFIDFVYYRNGVFGVCGK